MFTELEASLADERRGWFNNHHAMLLDNLIACIQEQQAALEKMLYDFDESDCEYEGDRAAVANARAVLAKWRIE
jgi:hypothetical protein